MSAIRLEQVTKSFGSAVVVPRVDLEIADEEFVVFVGPSGCGKSTLLRLIAGLEDVSSGRVVIDGADATRLPPGGAAGRWFLRPLPAYERLQEHRVSAQHGWERAGGDR